MILDSGRQPSLWNEILSACVLFLNQIPSHRSKKSPYEFFKGASIPLNLFKPMGNPVSVLSNTKKSKLEPRGYFCKLIGLNAELKSYRISLDDDRMKLLDFSNDQLPNIDYGKFLIKNEVKNPNSISGPNQESPEEENVSVKEEEEDSDDSHSHDDEEDSSFDNSDNDHVAGILIPAFDAPVGQIIRDQTLLVKPFKYSHYSEYPQKFCQAISCEKSSDWQDAIENELNKIEDHEVW